MRNQKPGACPRRCESEACAPHPERNEPDAASRACWNEEGHCGLHLCQDCYSADRGRRGPRLREAVKRIPYSASVSASTPAVIRASGGEPGAILDAVAACLAANVSRDELLDTLRDVQRVALARKRRIA